MTKRKKIILIVLVAVLAVMVAAPVLALHGISSYHSRLEKTMRSDADEQLKALGYKNNIQFSKGCNYVNRYLSSIFHCFIKLKGTLSVEGDEKALGEALDRFSAAVSKQGYEKIKDRFADWQEISTGNITLESRLWVQAVRTSSENSEDDCRLSLSYLPHDFEDVVPWEMEYEIGCYTQELVPVPGYPTAGFPFL